MIPRRIFPKKRWSSAANHHCLSYTTLTSPPCTTEQKPSRILWFSSHPPHTSQHPMRSSNYSANYLNNPFNIKGHCFSSNALADLPVDGVVDIPLAQTGEGIAECELLKWFVQEGDEVEEYQPLCEVQSDKATIEITSRYKGKVSQVLHVPGDIVKVGETLLKLVVDEFPVAADASEKSLGSDTSDSDGEDSQLRKTYKGGSLSTPAVRNLAKQLGINIDDICGTGKHGRVLKEDVLKYSSSKGILKDLTPLNAEQMFGVEEKHQGMSVAHGSGYEDETFTLRAFQRAMVKSMTLAAKIPHFHYVEEIDCDALVKLKAAFQEQNSDPDIKFTFLPILIKSLSMALSRHPLLNSSFNVEKYEVTLKGSHNIGIAMATPFGLVVPNIKNVQSLSILEITKELSRLLKLALANKLHPEDISGGTITLSNIGAIGGKFGSPLINVPEVSIIALGKIQKVAHFGDDGSVYPVSVMTVNIAADHRILDGANVAIFCKEWKTLIEKPELFLLHMK